MADAPTARAGRRCSHGLAHVLIDPWARPVQNFSSWNGPEALFQAWWRNTKRTPAGSGLGALRLQGRSMVNSQKPGPGGAGR